MFIRIRHMRDDERGMSVVFVCVGLMSFVAATTLAIDVGMLMTSRSQAQNSADAGALAGATALVLRQLRRSVGGWSRGAERDQHRDAQRGDGRGRVGHAGGRDVSRRRHPARPTACT